ncbi:MAG: acetate kinase [Candidatus Omnitrophota bacterium]|nr:MAG: acetate kinase [Candidatus Omnitrophota bacterium]RKY45848.1 MAG: acetate kinase [Candidatus Omnitrophota bacterium]HDN86055.1 acetate kinase [Candidatus Omnitrophota bacterium]
MKILTINCGSSSIKYKLYSFPKGELIGKGLIERIGEKGSSIANHTQGIEEVFKTLIESKTIRGAEEITAVGHRVVHGGEAFRQPHLIDNKVIKKIEEYAELAPLHNPVNLEGIRGCMKIFKKSVQVAVFDTAFHATLPDYAYLYALPLKYYKKYGVRRYGFHGTSHQFIAKRASQILKKPLSKLKLITCHLGNGCSITAVKNGRSIDTSMGFTPLEGLIMGTRSGDVDCAAILYIMEREKLSPSQMDKILNKESGLLGVSGVSNDVRLIKEEIKKGNKFAKLALDMFIYRIEKYIGSYWFILEGADAICFTGGIGEHNPDVINRIKKDIRKVISKNTKVLVISTDEELMIASLTYQIVKRRRRKIK